MAGSGHGVTANGNAMAAGSDRFAFFLSSITAPQHFWESRG